MPKLATISPSTTSPSATTCAMATSQLRPLTQGQEQQLLERIGNSTQTSGRQDSEHPDGPKRPSQPEHMALLQPPSGSSLAEKSSWPMDSLRGVQSPIDVDASSGISKQFDSKPQPRHGLSDAGGIGTSHEGTQAHSANLQGHDGQDHCRSSAEDSHQRAGQPHSHCQDEVQSKALCPDGLSTRRVVSFSGIDSMGNQSPRNRCLRI